MKSIALNRWPLFIIGASIFLSVLWSEAPSAGGDNKKHLVTFVDRAANLLKA